MYFSKMYQGGSFKTAKRRKMKRAIVNLVQFVRYLADRVSIKLTQFAMKKRVSARASVPSAELFLCLQNERKWSEGGRGGEGEGKRRDRSSRHIPSSTLLQRPTLCIFHGVGAHVEKRGFKNLTAHSAHSTQSTVKRLNQRTRETLQTGHFM